MRTTAVILSGPKDLGLQSVQLNEPAPGDIVVEITHSGISTGTEKLFYTGQMPPFPGMGYPLVPGYEAAGEVVEAAPDTGFKPGDRVFVPGSNCFAPTEAGPVRGLFGAATKRLRAGGRTDFAAHGLSRPPLAEVRAVEKILRYAGDAGARVSVCHVSTPGAMELIRGAKRAGRPVYAETCPQYLFRCEEDAAQFGPYAKYNPPIRDRASMEGLWPFLTDGTVDYIGSDHGPFLPEEKDPGLSDIFLAPAGGVGFEERLPLLLTAVRDGRLAFDAFLRCTGERPARAFGLYPRKGVIALGADADLVLADTEHPFVLDRKRMLTKARETARLYDGREVVGRVLATWVRGRCVYSNGSADATARGWGQWLRHSGACASASAEYMN